MRHHAELLIDAKAILGEGPSWDAEKQLLYWVDIQGFNVHLYHPATGEDRTIEAGQHVGAVVPRAQGGAVLAMRDGFYMLDVLKEEFSPIHDPEAGKPGNRFNDGKCDAKGRFWAGTMSLNGEREAGSLYCLDTDRTVRHMLDKVSTSNGIAWSPDNTVMYYIDSPTGQVAAFNYDLDRGALSGKRIVVTIPEGEGVPDGMTVDAEGMLWVAQWGGYQVSRWNPATGEKIGQIDVPAAKVTSCIFGGDNLEELFITTARIGFSDEELKAQPLAGGLFRCKPGVRGLPTYLFQG